MENLMMHEELIRLGLAGARTQLLREKDGVLVARVQAGQALALLRDGLDGRLAWLDACLS